MLKQPVKWLGSVFRDELEIERVRAETALATAARARGYAVDAESTRTLASAWGQAFARERDAVQNALLECMPLTSTVTHIRKKRSCDLFRAHAADEGSTPTSTATRMEQRVPGCIVQLDADGYLVTVPLSRYRDAVREACDSAVRTIVHGPVVAVPRPRLGGAARRILRHALLPCTAPSAVLVLELLCYMLVFVALIRL